MPGLGLGTQNFPHYSVRVQNQAESPSYGIHVFLRAAGTLSCEPDLCSAHLCVSDPQEGLWKSLQGTAWPFLQQLRLLHLPVPREQIKSSYDFLPVFAMPPADCICVIKCPTCVSQVFCVLAHQEQSDPFPHTWGDVWGSFWGLWLSAISRSSE